MTADFRRVSVLGLGLIGGSLLHAVHQTGLEVVGYDVARSLALLGMIVVHCALVLAADRSRPPWLAAVLQSAVNVGTVLASLATYLLAAFPHRYVFLVGVLPALLVLWIRRSVPEPEEWRGVSERKQGAGREATESSYVLFHYGVLRDLMSIAASPIRRKEV